VPGEKETNEAFSIHPERVSAKSAGVELRMDLKLQTTITTSRSARKAKVTKDSTVIFFLMTRVDAG
jgi:hypothetical protein